jgi:hypothetical protein
MTKQSSNRVPGVIRILVAPPRHPHPASIGDVLETEGEYDPKEPWKDAGASRIGFERMAVQVKAFVDASDERLVVLDSLHRHGREPFKLIFARHDRDGAIHAEYWPMAMVERMERSGSNGDGGAIHAVTFHIGHHGHRDL